MERQVLVPFQGEGCGVAPLSWGQRELWGGMVQQGTWLPIGLTRALPAGTTVGDVADELAYLMGRHQSMRTRLRLRPDDWPLQVVDSAGEVPLTLVDAGDADPAEVAAQVEQRFREIDYDFVHEWPVRTAVVLERGTPTHQVTIMCHLVTDGFGGAAMAADLAERDPEHGRHSGPVPAPDGVQQPLAQAQWQRSVAGRRQNDRALRYWEKLLRQIPARRFAGADSPQQPRYWQAVLDSPATYLAVAAIAARTGADSSSVLLSLFTVALARVTGIHPVATRILVSNRFRPGLADVVAPVSQPGLSVVDVDGATVDEVVRRAAQTSMACYKHAYYDTTQLDALIDRIGHERGEELDLSCFFNDRRLPPRREVGAAPTPEQVAEAVPRTTFRWGQRMERPTERLFLHIEDAVDTVQASMWADTGAMAPTDIERLMHTLAEVACAAAYDPATPTAVGGGTT